MKTRKRCLDWLVYVNTGLWSCDTVMENGGMAGNLVGRDFWVEQYCRFRLNNSMILEPRLHLPSCGTSQVSVAPTDISVL